MAPERPALRYPGFCDGIDISEAQGRINARLVKEAGFQFAAVKASEGLYYCDPRAIENLLELRAVGLLVMVYGFARPSQGDPRGQAEKLFTCAGDVMPGRAVNDLEAAPAYMSPEQIVTFGEEFADAWLSHSALECGAYTYPDFETRRLAPALVTRPRLGRTWLWIARYGSNTLPWIPPLGFRPDVPNPWPTWTMHQYSGNGGFRVPGVPGDCDRNLFNGDLPALRRFMGGLVDPDAPTEPELPSFVDEATLELGTEMAVDFKRRPVGDE